jgi:hypothetical protein
MMSPKQSSSLHAISSPNHFTDLVDGEPNAQTLVAFCVNALLLLACGTGFKRAHACFLPSCNIHSAVFRHTAEVIVTMPLLPVRHRMCALLLPSVAHRCTMQHVHHVESPYRVMTMGSSQVQLFSPLDDTSSSQTAMV